VEFCAAEGIAHDVCGKVIVAVTEQELPNLQRIQERGIANSVRCDLIDAQQLREIEPHAAGIQALFVPDAGIVDYPAVCQRLAQKFQQGSSQLFLNCQVQAIRPQTAGVDVRTNSGSWRAKFLISCAGLQADRMIALSGLRPEAPIVPFRGEFYELLPTAQHLCRNLIYPVPDPQLPFLGVHFTRLIGGGVECGPNAVLAFAREGYRKQDINLRDLFAAVTYPGFLRMAARHWRNGLGELWRSWSKTAFVAALQRLIPEIRSEHLRPAPAGVRAQALGRDGKLLDEFVFQEADRMLHVGNAPSPAATAALKIGETIVERVASRLS
jgi:L-2-hydroxyglutarate oxidase LhgO